MTDERRERVVYASEATGHRVLQVDENNPVTGTPFPHFEVHSSWGNIIAPFVENEATARSIADTGERPADTAH